MTSAAKHTAGPALLDGQYVTNSRGATIADCGKSPTLSPSEKVANAHFIAEAFTVAHETGLTSRQLVEQRKVLLAPLKKLVGIYEAELAAHIGTQLDREIRAALSTTKSGA